MIGSVSKLISISFLLKRYLKNGNIESMANIIDSYLTVVGDL